MRKMATAQRTLSLSILNKVWQKDNENNGTYSLHNIISLRPYKSRFCFLLHFLFVSRFFCVIHCSFGAFMLSIPRDVIFACASAPNAILSLSIECNSIFLTVTIIVVLIIARAVEMWPNCGFVWYVCMVFFFSSIFSRSLVCFLVPCQPTFFCGHATKQNSLSPKMCLH